MSPEGWDRRSWAIAASAALRVLLWSSLAAEVAWPALSASARGTTLSVSDAGNRALAHLLILRASLFFGACAFFGWYYSP